MAGKGSDIIKIGFDYRASLNKFKQETENTFNDVQKEGKRIVIKLNANDTEILNKIEKLQKTKFKNLSLEFDGKPLDRQIQLLDDLQKMILNIVNLFNKGYKTDDIIDTTKTLSEIDKLTKKFDDINQKYDELSKKVTSDSGKDISLVDNEDFKKLSNEIDNVKMDIKNLQDTISQLNQDVVTNNNFSDKLQDGLSSISNEVVKLTSNLKKLQDTYNNLSTNSNAGKKKESKPKVSAKNKQTVEKTDPQKLVAQRKAYNELTDAIRNYSNISKRIANENPFEGDYEEAVRLENKIEELQNHPLLSQKQIETAQRSIERLGVSIDNITNKLNASKSDAISNTSKKINAFNVNGFSSNDFNNKYGSQINDLNTQLMHGEISIKNYNTECNKLISAFDKVVKSGSKIGDISVAFNEAEAVAHRFSESQFSGATLIEKGVMKTKNGISSMTDTIRLQNGEIRKLKYTYTDGFMAMSDVTTKFKVQASGLTRVFDELKQKVGDLITYWTANLLNPYDLLVPLRSAVSNVIDLNTEFTDLAKVSDASIRQLYNDFDDFSTIAKDVGGTITDTISATADWSRNGYGLPDSEELARVALIYKNVGDGIDIDAANESLISTLRGFRLEAEDAMHIIDVFNEVSNNEAISSSGIGEALQRSAASFNAANTSLEKSVALITATNSVLQDTSKTGNMWRTVSARLRGAETELKEMGEDTDGLVKSTSKLRELVKGITGFDIMVDKNTFKDIYDIVLGIGKEWQSLNDIDRAALLEALSGKQQSNALAATLNNVNILEKAYKEATDAEGSAMREQKKYQESVQYSIERTKASLEELSNDFMSSNFLKGIIDFGDGAINVLDNLLSTLGSFPTVIGSIMGSLTLFKNIGRRNVVLTISLSIV
ncbi:MAG: phage tail tape measure protein [Coprobacillus cateniformis]|nr:phage tail tape measure protein [Coprobacillus cateniformis]